MARRASIIHRLEPQPPLEWSTRHNWRDEYRRGTWAGRNTWVGRNYRDNFREARSRVLDRGRDRNFRQEFVRNIRERNGGVAGASWTRQPSGIQQRRSWPQQQRLRSARPSRRRQQSGSSQRSSSRRERQSARRTSVQQSAAQCRDPEPTFGNDNRALPQRGARHRATSRRPNQGQRFGGQRSSPRAQLRGAQSGTAR